MRSLIPFMLAAWLVLATAAFADEQDTEPQPSEPPTEPSGPALVVMDAAPVTCDATVSRQRFIEVRGAGFDAWALQRLAGSLVDAAGTPQASWTSIWVSPLGQLTLEINLCADPFRGRPALGPGTYTVWVGPSGRQTIAATSLELSAPADAGEGDMTAPDGTSTNGAPTPANDAPPPRSTGGPAGGPPLGDGAVSSGRGPSSAPRTGPGSRQQPFPLGAGGLLVDGWQLIVTGVTPDAWDGIQAAIPSARPPASDQRDFMVRIEASYRGDGTGTFSAGRLALISASGAVYDQIRNTCGIVPDMPSPNLVVSGGAVRGNVCFTVRASDVDSLVLYDSLASEVERPYFNLR